MKGNLDLALQTFAKASAYVKEAGFLSEIEWQGNRCFLNFSESDLLRETAWVILCTGFRESIVRRMFDHISLSFCDWESAASIVESASACRNAAMASIRNSRKLDAIIQVAYHIDENGFDVVKRHILSDPVQELQTLPYIGPVTAWHLAKNLGYNAAKPDRHLVRLCDQLGYEDVQELCGAVAVATGHAINVVDIILWRYIADHRPRMDEPLADILNNCWLPRASYQV